MRKTAPFGSWKSIITAGQVARGAIRYGMLKGRGNEFYWSEGRPGEGGRTVIVHASGTAPPRDILPAPYSARSKVHEYGGGEFFLGHEGLFFANADDQDLYHLGHDGNIKRITCAPEWRFADGVHDRARNRLICIGEKKDQTGPQNYILAIALDGENAGTPQILLQGHDFYACPRLNRDGTKLAWIDWDLPAMPWESSRLRVGAMNEDGRMTRKHTVAGGANCAATEPQWDDQGRLYFISDQSGWGTIHIWEDNEITALPWQGHEFGRPLWGLGASSYALCDDGTITALSCKNGELVPALFSHEWARLKTPARQIDTITAGRNRIAAAAITDTAPQAICILDENLTSISKPALQIPRAAISIGQIIKFATGNGQNAHGLYYPPRNPDFAAPEAEKPPAILLAHGGPTGMADRGLKLKTQYWTSRGFAVFDVDYRGSTGYGREYRDSLNGQWGMADAQDMENGARHLIVSGLADPERLLISGSSAGGFTVLAALCRSSVFAAGASYYGIGDLEKLQALTHKFESGYLHTLLGDDAEVFEQKSPLYNAGKIHSPVIFFQGADDPVVPPAQSRDMHNSLKTRAIPTSYIEFEGESHGFRRADTIIHALKSEYSFYAQILGLEPQEDLPRIKINNFTRD